MFNYKRDTRKKIHLIKKYLKRIKKTNEDINNVNRFILDNCIIVNIITSKYFPNKITSSLNEYISNNNYRVYEEDIICFINDYKKINKYRFSYFEIQIINQIVMYVLISKLVNIIQLSSPNIIKDNTRRNAQIYNIILTMNELYNWNIDNVLLNTSDCDNLLLKIDEFKYLDAYSRNKYREKIKCNSIKEDKTEYIYVMEMIRKHKKTGKCLCELLFRRINYKMVNILVIILSFILSIILSIICMKIIDNIILFIPFLIINYQFLYNVISYFIPKEFVPRYNLKNDFLKNKLMVFKYIYLTDNLDIENELKILEKIHLENKSNDIDYTLCIECNKNIKLLTKENTNIVNKAYLECKRLNNKYSREIFYVIYSGNNTNYYKRSQSLNFFSKVLLHKDSMLERDNYYLGNNNFRNDYKYVLSIDDSIKMINIKSLINYLLHPYNKPIFKNNKLTYGYGSISLDGMNRYNESIDSSNYLYDLMLYDKIVLNNKNTKIQAINLLRDYSIELKNNNNYTKEVNIIEDVNIFKESIKNRFLNSIFKIKYFHKLLNVFVHICSFSLLIYLLFNKMSILWLLYLVIVTPYFVIFPSLLFNQLHQLLYNIICKKNIRYNKYYIYNYIMCMFIIVKELVTRNNMIISCILIVLFLYVPLFKKYVDKIRRKYYD